VARSDLRDDVRPSIELCDLFHDLTSALDHIEQVLRPLAPTARRAHRLLNREGDARGVGVDTRDYPASLDAWVVWMALAGEEAMSVKLNRVCGLLKAFCPGSKLP
jgi:hypothetical protein